jgi:hypothetical protein
VPRADGLVVYDLTTAVAAALVVSCNPAVIVVDVPPVLAVERRTIVKLAEKPEPAVVVHEIVIIVILIVLDALPVIVKMSVVAAAGTIPLAHAE